MNVRARSRPGAGGSAGGTDYDREEMEALARVLGRGWLSMGPEVLAFERAFVAAAHATVGSAGACG